MRLSLGGRRMFGPLIVAIVLVGALTDGSPVAAQPARIAARPPRKPAQMQLRSDFNGDGYDDLAISDFGYMVDGVVSAGAVSVIYGSSIGLASANSQLWTENSPGLGSVAESVDLWGRALASADFNGDGYADLAIGDGNKDITGVVDAGSTTVIYGGPNGLDAFAGPGAQVWNENTPGLNTQAVFDDNFGRSVFGADFNGDGYADLGIGVAYKDINNFNAAGATIIIYGGPSGLDAFAGPGSQFWSQDSPNVQGDAQLNDRFGWDLTSADFNLDGYSDLAIGVPGDQPGGLLIAGSVNVIYGGPNGLDALAGPGNQLWTQDSPGVPDVVEGHDAFGRSLRSADFNGDGYPDLAIGSPGEGVGPTEISSAGAVFTIYSGANGLDAFAGPGSQEFTQDTPKVKDQAEADDLFGRHLGVGDFNNDGYADLAVGVVNEAVGTILGAGAVNVLYGSANGIQTGGNQFWTQDSPHILGIAEAYDAMGRGVMGFDFNADGYSDLAIGAPGDTVSGLFAAGDVNVLLGSSLGLTAVGNQRWTLDSPGIAGDAQAGSLFGAGFVGLPAGSCGKPALCNETS